MHERQTAWWRTVEAAAVCLFTLQAVRALLAMLFAQVYDAMFDGESLLPLLVGLGFVVLMLAMPLFSPRQRPRIAPSLRIAAVLCSFARALMSVDLPLLRLACAALALGFAGFYVAGTLRQHAQVLAPALSLGAIVDQGLRAWGHTYDLSLRPWWILVQILLSLGVILLAERLLRDTPRDMAYHQAGLPAGIAFGAALFMVTSLLALPNAAARWTGGSYPLYVLAMLLLSSLPLWPGLQAALAQSTLARARWPRVIALFLLVGGLVLADKGVAPLNSVALLQGLAVFWLLLPASLTLGRERAALGVSLGLALWLLLSAVHALSFTYAYTLDLFKGAALPAFVAGALLTLGITLWPQRLELLPAVRPPAPQTKYWLAGGALIVLLSGGVALPRRLNLPVNSEAVRLGTYNIHYGYNTGWRLSLSQQARTMAESQADLIALQEVDTARLTSYGIDNAYWLSRRLNMAVVYLPTVEHTTGIAMLSRLSLCDSGGVLLPSQQEPTGILHATVTLQGAWLRTHAIWLGLEPEERARQLDSALAYIGPGVATLAGDMNATPDSPVYARMVAAGFVDPFALDTIDEAPTSPAIAPRERIDYVWLRGIEPTQAQVLPSLASDHRMVVVRAE